MLFIIHSFTCTGSYNMMHIMPDLTALNNVWYLLKICTHTCIYMAIPSQKYNGSLKWYERSQSLVNCNIMTKNLTSYRGCKPRYTQYNLVAYYLRIATCITKLHSCTLHMTRRIVLSIPYDATKSCATKLQYI